MSSQIEVCPHRLRNLSCAACDVAPMRKFVIQSFPGRTRHGHHRWVIVPRGQKVFSSQGSGHAIPHRHRYCGQSFLGHAFYACILRIKAQQRAFEAFFSLHALKCSVLLQHWICRPETFLARYLCVGATDRVVTLWAI